MALYAAAMLIDNLGMESVFKLSVVREKKDTPILIFFRGPPDFGTHAKRRLSNIKWNGTHFLGPT